QVYSQDPYAVAVTPEANYSGTGAMACNRSAPHSPTEIVHRSPEASPPPAGDSSPAGHLVGDANENLLIGDARNNLLAGNRGNDPLNGLDRHVSDRAPYPTTRGAVANLNNNVLASGASIRPTTIFRYLRHTAVTKTAHLC